jgi:hypothetical protein
MEKASEARANLRIPSARGPKITERATIFRTNETILGVQLAKRVDQEAETDFHLD